MLRSYFADQTSRVTLSGLSDTTCQLAIACKDLSRNAFWIDRQNTIAAYCAMIAVTFALSRAPKRALDERGVYLPSISPEGSYGRGAGVGRGLGVGLGLGVALEVGVDVTVGVAVGVTVGAGVVVAVGVAVGV